MDVTRRTVLGGLAAAAIVGRAAAQGSGERVTYLLPAPAFLEAFAPHQLALARGYFREEGVNLTFQTGRGGADVATQVAVGNAEVGGGLGDTPIVVRPNGLAVRGVALLGNRPLFQIAIRKAAGLHGIPELRGKRVGVIGFQDSGYYALLGVLGNSGLRRTDVNIQAVGNAGVTQLMISGNLEAIVTTPEWGQTIENAGVPLDYYPIDTLFPAMAQAVLASDRVIAERPAAVRGVVRGVLKSVNAIVADPVACARDYAAAVPQHANDADKVAELFRRYASQVYAPRPGQVLGRFDPERVKAVQDFYVQNGVIQHASPVEELFTNAFVGG